MRRNLTNSKNFTGLSRLMFETYKILVRFCLLVRFNPMTP